jgi:hypothetical protein
MMRPLAEKGGIFLEEAIGHRGERSDMTAKRSVRIGLSCIGILESSKGIDMSFGGIF